jgi:Winged helix-turn-helix domain (DUF2582)
MQSLKSIKISVYFVYTWAFIFIGIVFMKKPKIISEKPAAETKTEKPAAVKAVSKKKPTSPATVTKTETVLPTPKTEVSEAKAANPPKATATKSVSEAPAPDAVKTEVVKKPTAAIAALDVVERIGLTAGSIWNYLTENGATSVAKLIAAIDEEEKIVQRSIGWLAKEGKVSLSVVERIETITLNQ